MGLLSRNETVDSSEVYLDGKKVERTSDKNPKTIVEDFLREHTPSEIDELIRKMNDDEQEFRLDVEEYFLGMIYGPNWDEVDASSEGQGEELDNVIDYFKKHAKDYKLVDVSPKPTVYEQTFFTNRAPGDESHLLKWYEPVGKENFDRIISRASKEPFANSFDRKQKSEKRFGFDENTPAGEVYKKLSTFYFNTPKAASEFLARADIDGIKYPVDSYGGKTVKDGDKVGWNYVSFRDDNIEVNHKWRDGVQLFRRHSYTQDPVARQLADQLGISPREAAMLNEHINSGAASLLSQIKRARDLKRRGTMSPEAEAAVVGTSTGTAAERAKATAKYVTSSPFFDKLREYMQDSQISLKRLEEKNGIGKHLSAYYQFDRNNGLIAEKISQFDREVISPLAKEIANKNIDFDELQMYLLALHGEERNRMIAERSDLINKAKNTPARQYIDAIISGGIDIDDAALDNICRLAGLRPSQKAELRQHLSGSGASTAFWNKEIELAQSSGFAAKAQDAVKLVREITQRTRDILVESGRLSKEQAAAWEKLSPNYVPYRTNVETDTNWVSKFIHSAKDETARASRGSTQMYGQSEFHYAFGRKSLADDPIGAAIEQYHDAVARSYDNIARKRLVEIVRGNSKLGKVFIYLNDAERKELAKKIKILTNAKNAGTATAAQLAELAEAQQRMDEANNGDSAIPRTKSIDVNGIAHTIPSLSGIEGARNAETPIFSFKENGELKYVKLGGFTASEVANGGYLADNDALDIAKAVKKHGIVASAFITTMRRLTGAFSAMRTSYAPTFVASNLAADRRQAAFNIGATYGAKGVKKFKDYQFNTFKAAIAVITGNYDLSTKTQRYAKEWAENGGRIGGMSTENLAEIRDAMRRDIDLFLKGGGKVLGEIKTPQDLFKAVFGGDIKLKDRVRSIAQFNEFWNAVVEMSTRIATYATCRDMDVGNGKSEAERIADAISYSRDVTVNFNRKGNWTPFFNALWAFSNANIQDLQRSIHALGEGNKVGGALGIGKFVGKSGLMMYLFTALLGFIRSLIGHSLDDEKDEREGKEQFKNVPEYQKANLFGTRALGKDVGVPIRGFSRIPYYLGNNLYEAVAGHKSIGRATKDQAGIILDTATEFNGAVGSPVLSAIPTVARAPFEIAINRKFNKSQIYREPFGGENDKATVRSGLGRGGTSSIFKGIAQGVNWLTGGNENSRGMIDVQPEIYEHLWEWLGGSVARDITQITTTIKDIATFNVNNMNVRQIPLVSRIVKPLGENSRRYYEARDEYDKWKKYYDNANTREQREEAVRNAPYLSDKRWANEVADLRKITTNLLKRETRVDSAEEREAIHKARLKSQFLFMWRLEHDPHEDNADNRRDQRTHNRVIDRMLKAYDREDKKADRNKSRELR